MRTSVFGAVAVGLLKRSRSSGDRIEVKVSALSRRWSSTSGSIRNVPYSASSAISAMSPVG